MTVRLAGVLLLCAASSGCLTTSAEKQAEQDLGPEEPGVGPGPYHRPGQPCLTCHGEDHNPGQLIYELAGTVYLQPGDRGGIGDVAVIITDAGGHEYRALSNSAGNFFVTLDSTLSEPRLSGRDGQLQIPRALQFPLHVRIKRGTDEQRMRGPIGREGSCAHCHQGEPGAASNGPIYLRPESAP